LENSKYDVYFISAPVLILCLAVISITGGCTTLDFEPPGRVNDVYRIKIENLSEVDVSYSSDVSFYYIDDKVNPDSLAGAVSSDNSEALVIESKEGTYGVSVDVFFSPGESSVRLFLERGSGTGDNFVPNEVVESKTGSGALFIRYGDYY
jgi:hypothetical protein